LSATSKPYLQAEFLL